jgi:transposase
MTSKGRNSSLIQEFRTLLRTRKQLVGEKVQHVQRIDKTLEDANIKVSSVITDIMGKRGRAFLQAIIEGETSPKKLVMYASPRLKAGKQTLIEALRGRATQHHQFLLKLRFDVIRTLESSIAGLDSEARQHLEPFNYAVKLLITIPGVGELLAQSIISEIGVDMSRFPSAGHLVSWAGMCPRNDESAGKRRTTRVRDGAPWLKTQLVQGAWCATRTRGTYSRSQLVRIRTRRGPRKAIMAVASSILTAAYFMLRDGTEYRDLGVAERGA